jgi:hypothetical protein
MAYDRRHGRSVTLEFAIASREIEGRMRQQTTRGLALE